MIVSHRLQLFVALDAVSKIIHYFLVHLVEIQTQLVVIGILETFDNIQQGNTGH